ncbi:hypothetical protein GMB29_23730 [Metabacillus sediminilitoris]|nr:hypothetical protein GMB29_23730 [Metabacillus sediminilitoris]
MMKDQKVEYERRKVLHKHDEGPKGRIMKEEKSFIGLMKDQKVEYEREKVLHKHDEGPKGRI